jgi:hypothetical protein
MEINNEKPYTGQCLCGSIKYEIDKIEKSTAHCHCSMCRKFHGAAFATFGAAKANYFKWLQGEDLLHTYIAPNDTERKFCKACGSSLIFVPSKDSGEFVLFTLGTLDSDIEHRPSAHIFVDSKASWYCITDESPQFKEERIKIT